MDVRELAAWEREAAFRDALEKRRLIEAARFPYLSERAQSRAIDELDRALELAVDAPAVELTEEEQLARVAELQALLGG